MNIGRTSNPALNRNTFANSFAATEEGVMTIQGTVNKIGLMLVLTMASAAFTWSKFFSAYDAASGASMVMPWMIGGGIGGFIAAIITVFSKKSAKYTAPIYAVLEGLFLGAISAFAEAQFQGQGIVLRAVLLTISILVMLLLAYKSGWIKATENFKLGVVAATGGIFIMYLISWILGMFGMSVGFIHGNGILSILVSLAIVVIASLNLVLDFDFIESGAEQNAPKYMEWYAAFGLMVTLIWLYVEILRLLMKLASRD
jgi:uncharacterized YccA/Bax inhibitor family protein